MTETFRVSLKPDLDETPDEINDRSRLTMNDSESYSPVKPVRSFRKQKPPTGYENLGRLVQLSFTFFILFCAFFTCQNMTTFVLA